MRHFQPEAHLVVFLDVVMKQGCFFVCCNQKKTRGENLFTLKKFGKGEILMHSWILTIVVRCFNKGLELPWRLLTLDSKFQESCEFFQLRMTIYVTWPPCLGLWLWGGKSAIFRRSLAWFLRKCWTKQGIPCYCWNAIRLNKSSFFPRGDAFPSQLLHIFLHDDVTTYGSGYTSDCW